MQLGFLNSQKSSVFRLSVLSLVTASTLFGGDYYYCKGEKVELQQDAKSRSADENGAILNFKNKKGQLLGVGKAFVARFADESRMREASSKFGFEIVERLSDGIWLLRTDTPSGALNISAQLIEEGFCDIAHPDFIQERKRRTLDPLYAQAWHLENNGQYGGKAGIDIRAVQAWTYTKGEGVKVAIYDDAVDIYHEDITGSFIDGYDFDLSTSVVIPTSSEETHGTEVAGLALARENDKGSVGVAPASSLYVIKQVSGDVSKTIKAFEWAKINGVDVVNCSWGTGNVSDAVRVAIDDLATNGRGGKGAIVVFASGNDNVTMGNDESALSSVIGVGSSTNLGERAWYSNFGPGLDLLAPSGGGTLKLVTTDVSGNGGHATVFGGHPNYVYATESAGFNGTSASAPIVAGVAALVLAANADLTRTQVQDILAQSATKIGPYAYEGGRNDYYGYGMVNAGAAVERAISMKNGIQQPSVITLKSGWNLITPSMNGSFAATQISSNPYVSAVWEFDSGVDYSYKAPATIEAGKGYWVKSLADTTLSVTQYRANATDINIAAVLSQLSVGRWHLLGFPVNINNAELAYYGINSVYSYDVSLGGYVSPSTIVAGNGFWGKK